MKKLQGKNKYGIIPFMVIVLGLAVVFATAFGAVNVPYTKTFEIIVKNFGLINSGSFTQGQESIIYYVRFPRVIAAMIVGAALAVSGCVMQGMFKNPMADPGIIGVSSGASLGAVVAIALNLNERSIYSTPIFAVSGALIAASIIYGLASRKGKIPVLTLILSGIAVSTFLGSVTNLILTSMNEYQVREYLFWAVGSLDGRRWEHVNMVIVPIIISITILITYSRELNILLLGEEEAHSLGLNPSTTRKKLLFFVSVTTALAVCISGNISFAGLIVPHIMRLITGPDNKILLPASVVAGSIFMVVCDLIARTVIMPSEIGVGIVTSLVGAPYFLYLLNKARKGGESF